jgi:hypothetical protein
MATDDVVSPEFELGGYRIGGPSGEWDVVEWDAGELQQQAQDEVLDGRTLFGRDTAIPPIWVLQLRANASDEQGAQTQAANLASAWRPAQLEMPGADVALRYRYLGRWRRIYGRPRQIGVPSTGPLSWAGRSEVPAAFQLSEALHFDDAEQSVSLTSIPPTVGGLVAPIVAPITTAKNSEVAAGSIAVGGDTETPLRVVFRGPITDPWMTVGGVRIALSGRIAAGQTVTVDARARTVLRQDGGSVAGMLSRTARMGQLRLPPGTHAVRYGGTGTARATVAWRNAWRTL